MRNKLRALRETHGYTQEDVSSALNISRSTYTNIETGKKNPSLELALKIKSLFKYSGDDIFLNI